MNIPWALIFEIVRELIENCSEDTKVGFLRNPQPWHKRWFEVRLRREMTAPFTGTMSRKEWRENKEEILQQVYDYGAAAGEWELSQIVEG